MEERNKPSSLQSLVGLVEERRGEGGFCTLRWVWLDISGKRRRRRGDERGEEDMPEGQVCHGEW